MAIPDYQFFLLPILKFASDGREHNLKEMRDSLVKEYNFSNADLSELLPSGTQTKFINRTTWAKVYLSKAGLLKNPRRGIFSISERGQEVLTKKPDKLSKQDLEQYPEFQKFQTVKPKPPPPQSPLPNDATPEEALENAYQNLRSELADSLIEQVKSNSPDFFERLVVRLLVRMGYGGSIKDAGQAIGKSGDEGIDGIIKEDKLGLDTIYIQAKRWENLVSRPEIQKFVGALHGQRAKKGVFITTSTFSSSAIEYVLKIDPKVVLIDGEQLVQLMIDYNLGVSTVDTFELKKIDMDFFVEE